MPVPARDARRPEPRLPRPRRDRRDGDLRSRADPRPAQRTADLRLTAFVNREAGRLDGPWDEIQSVIVPVQARRRTEWVRGEQHSCRGSRRARARPPPQPREHRARCGAVPPRRDDPRPHLPHLSGGALRVCGRRDGASSSRSRHAARTASSPRRRALATISSGFSASRPRRSTSSRKGRARRRAEPTSESRAAATLDLGERPRRPDGLRQAAAQEPASACSTRSRSFPASAGRCSCSPATRRPRGRASRARSRSSASTSDTRFLGWVSTAELEGLYAARVLLRLPVALRGVRAAGARGDGAGRSGRVLRSRLAR